MAQRYVRLYRLCREEKKIDFLLVCTYYFQPVIMYKTYAIIECNTRIGFTVTIHKTCLPRGYHDLVSHKYLAGVRHANIRVAGHPLLIFN